MENQGMEVLKNVLLKFGIVAIFVYMLCFAAIETTSISIEEEIGYKPSAEEMEELFETSEQILGLLGSNLESVAEEFGISSLQIKATSISLKVKQPSLIVGILCILGFVILKYSIKQVSKNINNQ